MSELVEVTLRWYHGGVSNVSSDKLEYVGGQITEYLNVDVDRMSFFELTDCVKELGYTCHIPGRYPWRDRHSEIIVSPR